MLSLLPYFDRMLTIFLYIALRRLMSYEAEKETEQKKMQYTYM